MYEAGAEPGLVRLMSEGTAGGKERGGAGCGVVADSLLGSCCVRDLCPPTPRARCYVVL